MGCPALRTRPVAEVAGSGVADVAAAEAEALGLAWAGLGERRWHRHMVQWPVAPTREQELKTLKQQASYFQAALEDIQKRIDKLGAEAK